MIRANDSYTGFDDCCRLAQGDLPTVALALKRAMEAGAEGPLLVFSDRTGRVVDLDLRGSREEILARLAASSPAPEPRGQARRGRGRPKLGVVGREVTLLPRHWEWLAAQPGGASVALRKLVDEARRNHGAADSKREAQARTYQFLTTIAGDRPGFEECLRALYAGDRARFVELASSWPPDIMTHALDLGAFDTDTTEKTT